MYYGKRKDLAAFLNIFFNWAMSQRVEAVSTYDVPIEMTTQKYRDELYNRNGKQIVDQSLSV